MEAGKGIDKEEAVSGGASGLCPGASWRRSSRGGWSGKLPEGGGTCSGSWNKSTPVGEGGPVEGTIPGQKELGVFKRPWAGHP